jgi:hypothetical protein
VLHVGSTIIRNVRVAAQPVRNPGLDGRIGMQLLSRYVFVMDVRQSKLWLIALEAPKPD